MKMIGLLMRLLAIGLLYSNCRVYHAHGIPDNRNQHKRLVHLGSTQPQMIAHLRQHNRAYEEQQQRVPKANRAIMKTGAESKERLSHGKTFMFLVGLEGVGHHAMMVFLPSIAKACKKSLNLDNNNIRVNINHRRKDLLIDLFLRGAGKRDDFIAAVYSFPVSYCRDVKFPMYDLTWVLNATSGVEHITPKFLHLIREPVDMVMSRANFDKGIKPHTHMMIKFNNLIKYHYNVTKTMESGSTMERLWAQLTYESLVLSAEDELHVILENLYTFLEWKHCNTKQAVQDIIAARKAPRHHNMSTVSAADLALINGYDWSIPMSNNLSAP